MRNHSSIEKEMEKFVHESEILPNRKPWKSLVVAGRIMVSLLSLPENKYIKDSRPLMQNSDNNVRMLNSKTTLLNSVEDIMIHKMGKNIL